MNCYVVAILDRFGSTPCGTFPTPGPALAFLEKRRAEWPQLQHGCYDADAPEAGDCEARLVELACSRWGVGQDRCILANDHIGPCADADGNTTLTLAAPYLAVERQLGPLEGEE